MGKILRKFMPLGQFKKQDGQILLVVILATVVALTVGLSAITRTITNTRLSTEEANSQKALAAAEAGIEQLLSNPSADLGEGTQLSNNSKFTANSIAVEGTQFHLNDGNTVRRDDGSDIWLTESPDFTQPGWPGVANSPGDITIHWTGGADCNNNAAIEIVVIEGDRQDPSIARYTADECIRGGFDGADVTNETILGKQYKYSKTFSITSTAGGNGGYIVRVIPLFADTEMAVVATTDLPVQGYTIESVGESGDTTRKLRVYQPNPRLPIEFFPYNVFLPEDKP